jgi:translation initiation factor 2 gamma subunit (eIF-2gamma)
MKQIEKIGIIGHVDHVKTTLTADIKEVLSVKEKNLTQFKEERTFTITLHPPLAENAYGYISGGKSSRNQRREQKRKKKNL